MRESGYYPPGAEFDPDAPYNQVDQDFVDVDCNVCCTVTKNTTLNTDAYTAEEWEDFETGDDGETYHTGGISYTFDDDDLTSVYLKTEYSIPQLLNILSEYVKAEIDHTEYKVGKEAKDILSACKGWEVVELNVASNS